MTGLRERNMRGSVWGVKCMDMGYSLFLMEDVTREIMYLTKNTDTGNNTGLMEDSIKESGRIGSNMDKVITM